MVRNLSIACAATVLMGCIGFASGQDADADTNADATWLNYYDPKLPEQLLDEGFAALRDYDVRTAEGNATQALQALKVNYGLISERQFPALELLIESQLAQGRWQAVDQHFGYFKWLISEIYYKNQDGYWPGVASLKRLYLTAAADVSHPDGGRYLIEAKNLSWRAVTAIENRYGKNSLRLPTRLYDIVLIHFYQSRLNKRRWLTSYDYKSDSAEAVNGWSLSMNESLKISYNIGKELLERIRSIYAIPAYAESDSAAALIDAKILVYLADWEFLFERFDSSLNYYELAYAQFDAAGISDVHKNSFFKQTPVLPQPVFDVSMQSIAEIESAGTPQFVAWSATFPGASLPASQYSNRTLRPERTSASASFDLVPVRLAATATEAGAGSLDYRISNLNFSPLSPNRKVITREIRAEILSLVFRPKLVNAVPVRANNIALEYFPPPQVLAPTIGNVDGPAATL